MAIYYNRSAPAGWGVTEKGQLVQIPPGYTRQNDEYLPAKTGSNVPPPPSGFITVPNEQVGSYSTNDYDINKQNFYNESTGVGGVTVSVRKIPKTTLVSPSGQRIIARTDNVKGTSVPPADEYLRSGFSTEKAPGIPSGNTQSRGVGFEDLSRRSDLILPSGQHISAQDPNYSIYANQPGVKAYEAPKTSASSPVAPTDLGGIDTTGLPPYMVEVLNGIQELADQMKAQGKRVNPDITIDDATTQRFLEQAKSELGPYYRQQFQQTESDLKLGFQRLKEDQAKRELALSKQYGAQLEQTQESYAQRGLDFSTQRERAEKQLAEGYSTEIEKGISEAARSAEDLGTKGERVLGSAAYPSVDTSIRTGTTPGLGEPGKYGFNFGAGSRSLFNPIGGTLGTLERSRLFEEEKEKERFIRNETLRLSSTIQ